jgi:4-diphosphocytidyl-2-C-methyl-D-erythritol kinase
MQAGLNQREPRLKSHLRCDFQVPTTPADREGGVLTARCPAKINWTLRVLGRREDGYHELESLVTPVSLHDELMFAEVAEPGVRLLCDVPGVPVDESNLIIKAARRLAELSGKRTGLECRLSKRIPVGGGMGGGSSDAAGTLMALNRLWGLELKAERMGELAAELGSDVTLFLSGGPVIMRGRGERVEPVEVGWRGWVVLVFPRVFVSTAAVFKAWRDEAATDGRGGGLREGGRDDRPLGKQQSWPSLEWFLTTTCGAVEWMEQTFNMLEPPAMQVCPLLGELAERLRPMAGRAVRVSGSGSTLYTAFDEEGEAERFAARVRSELELEAGVVRPITRE